MTGLGVRAVTAAAVLLALAGCAQTVAAPVVPSRSAATASAVADPGSTSTITFTATEAATPLPTLAPTAVPSASSTATPSPTPTPIRMPTPTPTPTPSQSPDAAAGSGGYPGLRGPIDFGKIGQLTTAMTIQQIKTALRSPVRIDYGNPYCLGQTFEGAHGEQGEADALITALAATHGDHGPVDVLIFGTGWGAAQPSASVLRALPRTAEGIGLGSPFAAVRAAYPRAEIGEAAHQSGRQATVSDGHGRAIVFIARSSGSTVTEIATGVERMTPASDGCG